LRTQLLRQLLTGHRNLIPELFADFIGWWDDAIVILFTQGFLCSSLQHRPLLDDLINHQAERGNLLVSLYPDTSIVIHSNQIATHNRNANLLHSGTLLLGCLARCAAHLLGEKTHGSFAPSLD